LFKTLLSLKLLLDADDWPFFGKTKLIFYIFCPLCPKNIPAPPEKIVYLMHQEAELLFLSYQQLGDSPPSSPNTTLKLSNKSGGQVVK